MCQSLTEIPCTLESRKMRFRNLKIVHFSYDSHMYVWDCGWIDYLAEASDPANLRTWTFVKSDGGFQLYCDSALLVDFTYTEGTCFVD